MEQDYSFDAKRFYLGTLCKRGHAWADTNQSLRRVSGGNACIECEKIYVSNRRNTPEKEAYRRRYANEYSRAKNKLSRPSRSKHALPGESRDDAAARLRAERIVNKALRAAGRCPSVARLVMDAQREYWRENPEAKREHDRQWSKAKWWLEYQTKPELRLYTRQKSKRRKALLRQQTAHQLSASDIRARFEQFGNRCAYCGASGDMQIEHVIAISRGGTHAIGNIVPACQECNYSKRDKDVEAWYREQSTFCEKRWKKICRVLGWQQSSVGQIPLL